MSLSAFLSADDFLLLPATEELHAQKRKHQDEEEEKENEGDDGLHGVHQRDHQVSQRRPIPGQQQKAMLVGRRQQSVEL